MQTHYSLKRIPLLKLNGMALVKMRSTNLEFTFRVVIFCLFVVPWTKHHKSLSNEFQSLFSFLFRFLCANVFLLLDILNRWKCLQLSFFKSRFFLCKNKVLKCYVSIKSIPNLCIVDIIYIHQHSLVCRVSERESVLI